MTIQVGQDTAKARKSIEAAGNSFAYYSIDAATEAGLGDFTNLPAVLKVVLENMLRFEDGKTVTTDDIKAFADWAANGGRTDREIAYRPARVLMQDFTGVPAVVDLAAMRDGIVALGGDGFMLQTLHANMGRDVAIYGMNRGSVGFLMNGYDEEDLPERLARAESVKLHPLLMKTQTAAGESSEALA
ncbi:hypothetical protein LCGC14_3031860, partial [marine sediment metagenome]